MQEKATKENEDERKIWATFKCHCDQNTADKEQTISEAKSAQTKAQATVDSDRAQNSQLSVNKAENEKELDETRDFINQIDETRDRQRREFLEETDAFVNSIDQLHDAIHTLAGVGGDQTSSSSEHKSNMASDATELAKEELEKQNRVREEALAGNSALVNIHSVLNKVAALAKPGSIIHHQLDALIQAPGGTYSSQSGEVVGILKNMLATFKQNLDDARSKENQRIETYEELSHNSHEKVDNLLEMIEDQQSQIAENSESIETHIEVANNNREIAETTTESLQNLQTECADEKANYEQRVEIRSREAKAISEAIAILDSDQAFDTFADARDNRSFLQVFRQGTRRELMHFLRREARATKSMRLDRVAVLLATKTPFATIMTAIDSILQSIEAERTADEKQHDFYTTAQAQKETEKAELTQEHAELTSSIKQAEEQLAELSEVIATSNRQIAQSEADMQTKTQSRQERHALFNQETRTASQEVKLIQQAIVKLEKFYKWLGRREQATGEYDQHNGVDCHGGNYQRMADADEDALKEACDEDAMCLGFFKFNADAPGGVLKKAIGKCFKAGGQGRLFTKKYSDASMDAVVELPSLLQQSDPAAEKLDRAYSGQGGAAVIQTLQEIIKTSVQDLTANAKIEEEDQMEFDKDMTEETKIIHRTTEKRDESTVAKADTTRALLDLIKSKKLTQEEIEAVTKYLKSIDDVTAFWVDNLDSRNAQRQKEETALESVRTTLQGSTLYKNQDVAARKEKLGKCGETCFDGLTEKENDAKCEACKRGITVRAFCTGEGADADGCPP